MGFNPLICIITEDIYANLFSAEVCSLTQVRLSTNHNSQANSQGQSKCDQLATFTVGLCAFAIAMTVIFTFG
jgi:hypothetical protein